MGKFPFKRPRIISKRFPELDSSIDGVTKSLNDLVFSYSEQVQNALSKKHWLMAFSSIVLLLVLGSFISPTGKADSNIFYPETCLGGWINPKHAQGEPETTSNGDETQFTKENSAILPKNTNAEMYCGNFKGTFDAATRPTKIIVSLSLTKGADLTYDEMSKENLLVGSSTPDSSVVSSTTDMTLISTSTTIEQVSSSTSAVDTQTSSSTIASTSEVLPDSESTSTTSSQDKAVATPGGAKSDTPSIIDGVVKSFQDTVDVIVNFTKDKSTQTDTVVVPPPTPDESPAKTNDATSSSITSSSTSYVPTNKTFLSHFVETVFAQEESNVTSEPPVPQVTSVDTVVPQAESGTATEEVPTTTQAGDGELQAKDVAPVQIDSSTSTDANPSGGDTTSTSTSTTTDAEVIDTESEQKTPQESVALDDGNQFQNNFLEVLYSFDGISWTSLGELNEISMKYRTFEIPVTATTSWSKLEQLQIKVVAKKIDVETPTVYLDGITVDALFETAVMHDHPDFSRDTVLMDKSDNGNIRVVSIINSDTNTNEIWYTTLNEQGGYGVAPGSWVKVNLEDSSLSSELIDICGDNIFWIDQAQKLLWVTNLQKETNNGVGLLNDATTTIDFTKNNGEEWVFEYNYETKVSRASTKQ